MIEEINQTAAEDDTYAHSHFTRTELRFGLLLRRNGLNRGVASQHDNDPEVSSARKAAHTYRFYRYVVISPIIRCRRARRLVCSHLLGKFASTAVLEVGYDGNSSEGVVAYPNLIPAPRITSGSRNKGPWVSRAMPAALTYSSMRATVHFLDAVQYWCFETIGAFPGAPLHSPAMSELAKIVPVHGLPYSKKSAGLLNQCQKLNQRRMNLLR